MFWCTLPPLALRERHPVPDFFNLDILDFVPRADMASTEHSMLSPSIGPESEC